MNDLNRPPERPHYQRDRDLPRLIPAARDWHAGEHATNRGMILNLIETELRKERNRACTDRKHYQLERHLLLTQALKAERATAELQTGPHSKRTKRKKRYPSLKDSVFKDFNKGERED